MNDIQQTRLISVLRALNQREWVQFRSFIDSDLAGPKGKSLILYDLLNEFYPEFNQPGLTRRYLYKALFNDDCSDDKKLRYAMSELNGQAFSFMGFLSLNRNEAGRAALIKEELVKRASDKAYMTFYPSDEYTWKKDAPGDADEYFDRYRDAYIHLSHYLPRQKRSSHSPIGAAAHNLDLFYITRKLQLLCEMVNVRNVMAVEYDSLLQDELVALVGSGTFWHVPAIEIYYRVFMTLTDPEQEDHFHSLRALLAQHHDVFRHAEQRDLYQYLMNYCIKKINLGDTAYVQRLFEIYQAVLPDRILFTGDYLSQWDFKNIVTIGLRCDASSWVDAFIEKYSESLPPSDRQNAVRYNRAYYYYATREYKKALGTLQEVEFTDLYYQLDSRAILLKCYYELDDDDALAYHIGAFRLFLARNKLVSDYQRKTYSNLVRFTSALSRAPASRGKISGLLTKMDAVKQIADRGWLKRMADEKYNVARA